jgi:glyoxylase-like metal-dependent hydrolase (beta-lactamase superfamily II)
MRLRLLDLGRIEYDAGFPLVAGNVSTASDPNPESQRRNVVIFAALIEHPKVGPILFDCGVAAGYADLWPPPVQEMFIMTRYESSDHLDAALNTAGFDVGDINAVVLSHLHVDHGGGLHLFRGLDVPIYVHADELKTAFYSVATKEDFGPYLPDYLDFSLNWQPLHGDEIELFEGFKLHKLPGHAAGLLGLELQLRNAGAFFFTSDQFPLRENYEGPTPQGWLMRDHAAWWQSYHHVRMVSERIDAKLVFGHDPEVFAELTRDDRTYD